MKNFSVVQHFFYKFFKPRLSVCFFFELSENDFISYWIPICYSCILLLPSRPTGTRKFVSSVCCVYSVNRVVSTENAKHFFCFSHFLPTNL